MTEHVSIDEIIEDKEAGGKGMKRDLMPELVKWKNSVDRKPLLLRGARQVGKTWLLKEFGRLYFPETVYINFDRDHRLHEIFQGDISPKRLVMAIGAVTGKSIDPEKTLIIFDEIQEEPRALSSLKYFCEDAPEYAVVAAGSQMGVALHAGTSFPVGKVDEKMLYPLSFYEFLDATGKPALRELLETGEQEAFQGFASMFVDELRSFYFVGGMPEAVDNFAKNLDYLRVRKIQEALLDFYEQDFSKHAPISLLPRIRQVWQAVPTQLAKENRKFIFSQVAKGARARDFELAIHWLSDCGLIHLVHRVSVPHLPLRAYEESGSFKIYHLDIGLLGAAGRLPLETVVNGSRLFSEFKGAMTEQYVLQEMITANGEHPCYYSAENSRGEVDFILQRSQSVLPVEVKAEENLQAKSLKAFVDKYNLPYGVRISMSGYRRQERLINLPLYAFTGLLEKC